MSESMITTKPRKLNKTIAAAALLLLMLSSQVVGTSGIAKAGAQQAAPPPPAQPAPVAPPVASAPGELSYTNTWNRTALPSICVTSDALAQGALKPESQSWTLTSSMPLIMAEGATTTASPSQVATYTYAAYANGSFIASDNDGNDLSWKGITGFPNGQTTIKLYGNTTEALQLYSVGTPGHLTANFTVAYHLMQTTGGCDPHGVEVTIQGWADWPGGATGGTLAISFNGPRLPANVTGVSFGGRGGMKLVFDWSDSMGTVPTAYAAQTGTVAWSVGQTFKIDPSIVGQSSSQQALNWGSQRKLWHMVESNGTIEYWAFYYDGTEIEKAYSLNGVNWHSSYLTSESPDTIKSGAEFTSWVAFASGVYTLYYVLADPYTRGFYLGTAQLGNNGAVNGLVQTQFGTVWTAGDLNPCVYGSSTDIIAAIMTSNAGADQLEVYHISASSKQVVSKMEIATGTVPESCIALGLASGYALLYGPAGATGPDMVTTSADGNTWSAATTGPTNSPIVMSSAVAVGNMVNFATISNGAEVYWSCTYPCATTSSPLTLASSATSTSLDNIVLSTNARGGGASVTATYHDLGTVWSRTSDDGGKTWTPAQVIDAGDTGEIASGSLQSDYDYVQAAAIVATVDVAWLSGTSAPYSIYFPAFPVVVPSSSTTPDPWAKGGYSPYESYFSQLNEYVSPGNGLLGVSQTILSIPGRAPALSVTMVYSQPSDFVGTTNANVPYEYDNYTLSNLGIGWELDFPWIGPVTSGTTQFFHPGNGEAIQIDFNSSNIMEYHGSVDFVLYHNVNNGTYTLYTADGTKYTYAGLKLSTIISPDSASNSLTFLYNSSPGYITQITDGEGRAATFSYNANNTLASMSSGGLTWKYTYSKSDLSSVTDPLGRVTRYYYAVSHNPWLISQIAYPTGAATYYTYDAGLVAPDVTTYAVLEQYEYSSGSAQTLARTNSYLFNMVDGSMVSSQVIYDNATTAVQGSTVFDFRSVNGKFVELQYQKDQLGNVIGEVETDFDSLGQPNQTALYSPTGMELAYSVTHYDQWGNVNFTQDYDGHDTWFAYAGTKDQYQFGNGDTGLIQNFYTNSTIDSHIHDDLLGTGTFQNTANTNTPIETFYLYNDNEVLRQAQLYSPSAGVDKWLTTSYTYDGLANLQTSTDPLGHQTCYAYSSAYNGAYLTSETTSGSPSCHTSPNVSVSYAYNFATGEMTSQTDAKGNTTSYTYDALGRVKTVTYPTVNGVFTTTSYSYNDASNVVTETDQSGNVTKDYYDGLGRLIQQQTYLSPSSPYSSEYYTYNWLNQVLTDQAPNGATYRYTYDSLGRMVSVANPDGSHESASYNITANTQTITDGDGHQTVNVYDFMQNLVAVREYWTAGGYNATAYTYDGVGNLLKTVGPDGNQVTTYTYDDLDRLIKTTYPDGTTQKESYDAVGNLLSTTDQEGRVTTYSYDFLYRLTAVNYPDGSSTTYTYDKDGNELTVTNSVDQVKYTYDALNRMTSETDVIGGSSYKIGYAYGSTGDLKSITYPDNSVVTNSYDALGRITKVAAGSATYASMTYNFDGTINTMTYGNGEVTSYTYDSTSRPKTITTSLGSTQELSLSYTYDGAGNVASINSQTFGYDALNRLTSATGQGGTTTYSYDAAGNMAQKQNASSTVKSTYNSMDELVRSSSTSGAATYSYDGDGNLVVKNDGTNVWTYIYNAQGEMTKVLENGVVVQQNYYDGNGRRVEQTTGGTTTLYLYAGLNVLYQKNLQTGGATKYVYADGIQVAAITTAATLFLHQDELGSTRLVTSGSSPVFSSDYVPYGVQYGATGSQEFMYAGMLYDAATGLYYDNARFYDPTTGKFTAADPIGGTQSDPQSLNGYAYARDNPLAIVDPSGLDWWNPFSWAPTQAILVGAVIGLSIASALQFGLDPLTDGADAAAISAAASSFAGGVATSVAEAASEEGTSDLTTISDAIDEGLENGVNKAMASMLEEPGPEPTNSQPVGQWAQNFMRPLMRSLGFINEQYRIQIGSRTLIADFYNPDTGVAVDVKGGSQSFTAFAEEQAAKYTVAELNDLVSKFLYVYVQNPWSGEIADSPTYLGKIIDYGVPFTHVFLY
jgi:RHS repeat-associated protein